MADPVSAAGTAVGVVSVGIQVCQGLLSYYAAWKSYSGDITHLYSKIDGFKSTLENLETTLQTLSPQSTSATQNVIEKIASCQNAIEKLREILGKCRSINVPQGIRGKVKMHGENALYPLRKGILQGLKTTIADLQDNLDSALQTLTLDIMANQGQTLTSLTSTSAKAETEVRDVLQRVQNVDVKVDTVNRILPDIQQKTTQTLLDTAHIDNSVHNVHRDLKILQGDVMGLLPNIETQIDKVPHRVETNIVLKLEDHGRRLFDMMQNIERSSLQHTAEIKSLNDSVKGIQSGLIQKPDFLRLVCNEADRIAAKNELPDTVSLIHCNDISLAVLNQSESQLRKIITRLPQLINDANDYGQTPLHLSIGWAAGIKILIEAGVNVDQKDHSGRSPIVYACLASDLEALGLLGQADCALHTDNAFNNPLRSAIDMYEHPHGAVEQVVGAVTALLANRRQRLQALLCTYLHLDKLDQFHLSQDQILDGYAVAAFQYLTDHEITVPAALCPGTFRASVYHTPGLDWRTSESLWNAGFRDVDGFNDRGLTPLMSQWINGFESFETYIELMLWFVAKGARIRTKQIKRILDQNSEIHGRDYSLLSEMGTTALHWIAMHISLMINREISHRSSKLDLRTLWEQFSSQVSNFSETAKHFLESLFTDQTQDRCHCSCSQQGCRPSTIALKSPLYNNLLEVLSIDPLCNTCLGKPYDFQHNLRRGSHDFLHHQVRSEVRRVWISTFLTQVIGTSEEVSPQLFMDLVRLLTFEELDLTHTCCRVSNNSIQEPLDITDIHEIHDEETVLLTKLEALVLEFQEKKSELNVSIIEFLEGYWETRMKEVLKEPGYLNEEELQRIGVVVHNVADE
ncbi:MAG: hypothetical protein Q9187_000914 [Circinaria calcarea]